MPNFPESGIALVADLTDYSRNINTAIDQAGELESKLGDLASTMDSVGSDVDLSIAVDVDDADFSTLESDLDTFDGGEYEATAVAETEGEEDVSDLETSLLEMDEMVSEAEVEAETTGEEEVAALEDSLLAMDDMSAEAEVSVETPDPAADETIGLLKDIRAGVLFTMFLNIAGTALDFLNSIQSFTVDPFLDIEDATARFAAQTGIAADGIDEIMTRLHFTGDVGDFGPIADTLIRGTQLGIDNLEDLEEAAAGALQTAKSQGVDAVETLRAMNALVGSGLVESWTEAADVITVGIQEGNNRAGDMMQTLVQFAPMFAEMGLNAEQAMSLFSSGLDANIRSTSDIARAIDTMNKNITGAAEDSPIAAALDAIGVELPAAGEQVGVDFFNSVVEGIQKNPEVADAAIEAIFGGRADKISEAFGELTLADEAFDNLEGRAEDAATVIDDSLRGAIADFILWIQQEINAWASSAEIDLPGKIEELKERIQNTLTALASGEGLPVALEMAFEAPGLADKLERLEATIGNFIIEFALGVANIVQGLGNMDAAMDIRQGVEPQVRAQLAFDLSVADNQTEMTTAFEAAMRRGMAGLDVQRVVHEAMDAAAAAGDFDTVLNIGEAIDRELQGTGLDTMFGSFAQDAIDTLGTKMNEAMDAGDFELAASIAEQLHMDEWAETLRGMADEAETNFDAMAGSAEAADSRIHTAIVAGSIVPDLMKVSAAALLTMPVAGAAIVMMGNMAEQGFSHASYWALATADSFNTLGNTLPILQGINAELSAMASLGTAARQIVQSIPTTVGGGAGGGNTSNTTVNVNQTNNVQNPAQAASVGMATSRQIRGLAA